MAELNATLSHLGGRTNRRPKRDNGHVPVQRSNAAGPVPARVQAALEVLRAHGERVTRVRQAVIEVLDSTTEHLDADRIVSQAAASAPGVHRASVYRALATLGDLGLVTHTHIGGSAAVYHLAVEAPETAVAEQSHAHLQCSSCHRVIDIPVAVLDPLTACVERDLGFRLEPQHAALLGICADCR
jgi:Fur family transcriptional regulator, ferric uptake regulator